MRKSALFSLWQVFSGMPVENVMRRHAFIFRMCMRMIFFEEHTMPVTGSCMEIQIFVGKCIVDALQEFRTFFCCNVSCGMVADDVVLVLCFACRVDCYKICSERNIGAEHIHSDCCSLKRGTPREIFSRIIAHNRQVCGVASRADSFRNGSDRSDLTF